MSKVLWQQQGRGLHQTTETGWRDRWSPFRRHVGGKIKATYTVTVASFLERGWLSGASRRRVRADGENMVPVS